jgi:hypothetical protein
VPLGVQFFFEISQAAVEPLALAHRIASGMRGHQV